MGQVTFEWQSGRGSETPFSQVLKGKKPVYFFLEMAVNYTEHTHDPPAHFCIGGHNPSINFAR